MGIVRFTISIVLFVVSANSVASVYFIDKEQIILIATEAAYQEYKNLNFGDLDIRDDFLSIYCFEDDECYASVKFKVVPTITRTIIEEGDGQCSKKIEYKSVKVSVFPSGDYSIQPGESISSEYSQIDCELSE